jgi:Fe-S oxidoreductase
LVNFFTQTPPFSNLAKLLGGISQKRRMPEFAEETFRAWFARRPTVNPDKPRVLLWPDTFNNHFFPETLKAAVEVLETAGFRVSIPRQTLCCGRPLYDWGMLDLAKHQLRQILEVLHDDIAAGTPLIGLEPSCVSVFRDELKGLFPNSEQAERLHEQTFMLADFLVQKAPGFQPPKLQRHAIVHGHCHHKTVLNMKPEGELLEKMGLEIEVLDSGCCGMAGAFGFEAAKYAVSVACGERVLLPKVRAVSKDTLVIADGFSCREQIEQLTGRQALHVAEVLRLAMHTSPQGPTGDLPEQAAPGHDAERPVRAWRGWLVIGAAALGVAIGCRWRNSRTNDL